MNGLNTIQTWFDGNAPTTVIEKRIKLSDQENHFFEPIPIGRSTIYREVETRISPNLVAWVGDSDPYVRITYAVDDVPLATEYVANSKRRLDWVRNNLDQFIADLKEFASK